jgi:hypothetical protein
MSDFYCASGDMKMPSEAKIREWMDAGRDFRADNEGNPNVEMQAAAVDLGMAIWQGPDGADFDGEQIADYVYCGMLE